MLNYKSVDMNTAISNCEGYFCITLDFKVADVIQKVLRVIQKSCAIQLQPRAIGTQTINNIFSYCTNKRGNKKYCQRHLFQYLGPKVYVFRKSKIWM